MNWIIAALIIIALVCLIASLLMEGGVGREISEQRHFAKRRRQARRYW